jgi:hypothetical protein
MIEWLNKMNSADLSKQASIYAMRASEAVGMGTRETFDRLATECAALAALRKVEEERQTQQAVSRRVDEMGQAV